MKLTLLVGICFLFGFCWLPIDPAETSNQERYHGKDEEKAEPLNPFFVAQIETAAEKYKQFGRTDETQMYWAPTLCRARVNPKTLKPAVGKFSQSDDMETHGGKLYFLFAKDRENYLSRAGEQDFGQILVKESWSCKETDSGFQPDADRDRKFDQRARKLGSTNGGFLPFAKKDKQWFEADKKLDLFVMIKLSSKTPDSDQGWIYGTVNTKGAVTAAGKIESCMACHQSAVRDRMFFQAEEKSRGAKLRKNGNRNTRNSSK